MSNKIISNYDEKALIGQFNKIVALITCSDFIDFNRAELTLTASDGTVATVDGLIRVDNPISDYVVQESNRADRYSEKQARENPIKNDLIIKNMKENREFSKRVISKTNSDVFGPIRAIVDQINKTLPKFGYVIALDKTRDGVMGLYECSFTVYTRHSDGVLSWYGQTALLVDIDQANVETVFNAISNKTGLNMLWSTLQVTNT